MAVIGAAVAAVLFLWFAAAGARRRRDDVARWHRAATIVDGWVVGDAVVPPASLWCRVTQPPRPSLAIIEGTGAGQASASSAEAARLPVEHPRSA